MRFLGLSEAAPRTLERAHSVHPIAALQTEYSLWTRDPEPEVVPMCRKLGVAFVAYSPLGRGFLTGRFKSTNDLAPGDNRHNMPRFQGESFQKNLDVVTKVEQLAMTKGCSPCQLVLGLGPRQGERHRADSREPTCASYLDCNLGSLQVNLTCEELEQIDRPCRPAAGDRYNPQAMQAVNR